MQKTKSKSGKAISKLPVSIEKIGYETLSKAINKFMLFKKSQGLADCTMKDYATTFSKFKQISSDSLDVEVLKGDLLEFLTPYSDGSPAKFNVPYSNLNTLFNWLILQKVIEENPLKELGLKKKKDEGNIRCIEVEDIKKLLNVINLNTYAGLRDYTAILLMLDTGIRPTEMWRLEVDDIDFQGKQIIIRRETSKTKSKRLLPISLMVMDLLDKIISVKPIEWRNDLVFCTFDGSPMHSILFARSLNEYSVKANVKITPYSLRHTFAILYLRNEGNVFTLQRTMGHTTLDMTKRYLAISEDDMKGQHIKASPLKNVIQRNTRVRKLFK